MDISNVPVGQTAVVADNSDIKSTFTRVSQAKGLLQLYDPLTGKLVLKIDLDMNTGGQDNAWFDTSFWAVYVDGRLVPPGASGNGRTLRWDVKTKTINITS